MSSPPLSLDRSNNDTRSPIPESNASHDRSESEPKSPRQTPEIGSGNNSTSTSHRQSKSRFSFISTGLSPSPARSYKILKSVARRGYYEDVYSAYPSTDEDREGASIPCESDSDGPPTLSARVSYKKQSKRAAIKSRRQEERALADAFERRLRAGANESSAVLKMKIEDDEDAKAARDEFKQGKTFRQYMEELDQIDKSHPILPESYRRMFSWWKGCDQPMAPEKIAWHRRHMRQLEGVSSSEDSSALSSPRSTTPEPPSAVPNPVPQPESSQNVSEGTKGFVDPRTGEFMVPLSALKDMIPLSVLREKFKELPGDYELRNEALHSDIPCATTESNDTPKRANEALDRDIPCATTESNYPPKRANEGPLMDVLEPPAKKLRKYSGASGGETHGKDMGLTDDEDYETSPESRESSVPNWVRRSRRPASNSTPVYRADQHPADKFLDSSPKTQDETNFIHVVDSDDDDQDSDESVVRWPRKKSLSRPTEPPRPTTPRKQKAAPAVSPGSSGTPKKRGRKPGTRVVNGKVVFPSEAGSPSVPLPSQAKSPSVPKKVSGVLLKLPTKTTTSPSENPKFSFYESTITKKRTPIPSEKVRANAMYAAATKKAPAQPKSSKPDTYASKSKTQTSAASPRSTTTPSKSTQADKSPAKRKPPTLSTAASALTRRENGFIRGNTDFEEEKESTEAATTRNGDDAGKRKISFRVPPRRPTPPIPKSSGALNRLLFR
ncbi:hypothetical protein BKA80DRAFT_255505 [Phyllosticta citrichinensis]